MLLGGEWHDFDGFAEAIEPVLTTHYYRVQSSYNFEILLHLNEVKYDILLLYTCLATPRKEEIPQLPTRFSTAQVDSLRRWVGEGGGLLALHAATVVGESDPALESLLGGAFLRHPPESRFTVLPLSLNHPITKGIEAFEVCDELYIERFHPSAKIHMVAVHEQIAYPLVWSRLEGRGRVAHIAMGHSYLVWRLEPFQRLVLQAIQWLCGG